MLNSFAEISASDAGERGMGAASHKRARPPPCLLGLLRQFVRKPHSVCYLPLFSIQHTKVVVLDNLVELFTCFVGIRFARLFTLSWSKSHTDRFRFSMKCF